MAKPKTAYFPREADGSGIDITWTKSRKTLRIGGWFDRICGIESTTLTLREFFDGLGITEKDCIRAFKKEG